MIFTGQAFWTRFLRQVSQTKLLQTKRFAIAQACFIGLISALAAVFLKAGATWLVEWRNEVAGVFPTVLVLPVFGLVGGFLAGILVERFAPEASGSGISQVKAVLAGVPIVLNWRVAVVKLLAGVLTLGAGLTLGRQGPTVQVGAAIAAQLSRWVPTSPDYRRQLIAAGAGAGLAAAFNAPISGILFVVEELLQDTSSFTLGTAILASFIGAVVSRWLGGRSLDLNPSMFNTEFSPLDIPFLIALGLLAGGLGALFNQGIVKSLTLNSKLRLPLPIRVALAGFICGGFLVVLPPPLRDTEALRNFLVNSQLSWQPVALAFVAQFGLTLIAYGSGAPGGLFAPSLGLGAALGYLVGLAEQGLVGNGSPTTFALAGMGAFFSAVARGPITGIVIVFEMTTDFNLVLPLMIGSVIAYLVAEKISPGSLYDRLLAWKGIHLEDYGANQLWSALTAAEVMQPKVETLSSGMTIEEAIQAFSQSSHRNFPVLEDRKLVGIVTQDDLISIQKQSSRDIKVADIMTADPITVMPKDTLAQVLNLLNRYRLSALPVVEHRKLVGIITRGDTIRVEANYLDGTMAQTHQKFDPSYLVYQTCAPATGRGRLLVPLSNPQTATPLLKMAIAIARDRRYEVECLQVVTISRDRAPSETLVRTKTSQKLLRHAVQMGQAWQVPIHTQIRVAHSVSEAILEAVKERHVDLVLMGWKGNTSTPGRVFSRVVDTVIRQAPCEVVLAKLRDETCFDRWLIPIAGGPNAQEAIQLLPALTTLSKMPEVDVCQVFQPEQLPDTGLLEQASHFLKRRVKGSVTIAPVSAGSVTAAVIQYSQKHHSDVIMLGASRERLLRQVVQGNIPEAIARNTDCTVILVRGATA
ncbi:chloride channel protein [Myxacorys almedinensis]|uniref:Universal stress protein n=1 Tax=Myxacorys almedinensis A TaxID=2690445 RepID=A0A8J7YX30_9CYAN|nr:chloride channel protein [Myxacorys almedinensis]NDJ16199.1 universal stress protein [Myxacorys almedinensis A]